MTREIGPAPKYPKEFVSATEPNLSGKLESLPIPPWMVKAFADRGAEMTESWGHKIDEAHGLLCLVSGEPLFEEGRLFRRGRVAKHWHLSLSVKDAYGYLRWPTPEEILAMLNSFFVPGMTFLTEPTEPTNDGGRPIAHLWAEAFFNRYHRLGVSESE